MRKTVLVIILATLLLGGCIRIKQPCPDVNATTLSGITGAAIAVPSPIPPPLSNAAAEKNIKTVIAGQLVSFPNLHGTDPDGQTISYKFTAPLNAKGEWLTTEADVGEYVVNITLSDGENTITEQVRIIVLAQNHPPTIDAPLAVSVDEGAILEIPFSVVDEDKDNLTTRISGWVTQLPAFVEFEDAGVHVVRVHASDGRQETVHEVQVTVRDINRAPELAPINDVSINETDKLTIHPKASDPDQDALTFRFSKPLDQSGSWQPTLDDLGTHEVTVVASDGRMETSTRFTITVDTRNKPPVLQGLKDITAGEGDMIELTVDAVDPEGKDVELTIGGYMTGMSKQVDYDDAGVHTVRVTASDGERTTSDTFTVTINDVNRPPIFAPGAFE
ncbi:MAG TPA: hypothetical protein VJH22_05055 [Candidatus Nanoarchaeia archaeon]|nr:hypothetical protein [Candidatus Nanoarchaeia archaeon]